MDKLFFTNSRRTLDKRPQFAELVFPCLALYENNGKVRCHGIYINNRTFVTNSLMCEHVSHKVLFTNGIVARAEVTHRVDELCLVYLRCSIAPTLPHFRVRHEPIHKDTFVFDMSILPQMQVSLSIAGGCPPVPENATEVQTRHTLQSGSVLFSRHGEIMGMRLASIVGQDYCINVNIYDILRHAKSN
jgi:hypothetical protein